MEAKVLEKNMVIALRKKGLTYSQILKQVPVSKSSVSLWLMDYPLTETEKKMLKDKKTADMTRWKIRAAASLHGAKVMRDKELYEKSKIEFEKNINEPFFQVGISLYWAEGSKRSSSFGFVNSDEDMIKLMIAWVKEYLHVEEEIRMRVYTHKAFSGEHHDVIWSKVTGLSIERFGKIVYKSVYGLTSKKRPNYKGCVRIELGKVAHLRKMLFWQNMLVEYYKKQGYSV